MFATTAITLLCTAGISFYVRFLVVLCKACKTRRIGHWVCDSAPAKGRYLDCGNASDQ